MDRNSVLVQTSAPHLKRALGVWDLTWLLVVAVANLNVVPVIAASGPTVMWLWFAALLFFFLPQGICVIELSRLFPDEGGVYVWTKEMFGDFHGFLCGWGYWTANMFFIPSLLFYLLGIFAYVGGPTLAKVAETPAAFAAITISLLWITTFANIQNVGIGKWVSNSGGIGTLIATIALIALGISYVAKFGVTLPLAAFSPAKLDLNAFAGFGVICFALVGLELGCVMGGEIHCPEKTVPRGVLYGGILSGLQYLGATLALLLAVPQADMRVLQGVVQGVDTMTLRLGTNWLLLPIALLVITSILGATSAWLSGAARILFVSGIDQYLPTLFGRLHKKHGTPHYALCGIAVLSSSLIVMSFAGSSTIKEAYVTLLDLAVVLQMISYSYVYASLLRIAFGPRGAKSPHRLRIRFAAISGLVTTLLGLMVAFIPSHQVDSVWRFELKMVFSCLLFLGLGGGLFWYYSRRRRVAVAVVPVQA